MPYIKKTWRVGSKIEVEKMHSGRWGKRGGKHNPKTNQTPEEMAKVNERNAIQRLRRIIEANFQFGDYHTTLTYRKDERPTPEEAKIVLREFLREMRKAYKRKGQVLKYVISTEYQNSAIHHHIVVNDIGDTARTIRKLWAKGKAYLTVLDDTGQYGDLAAYLVKETQKTFKEPDNPNRLRYSCSRNLERPEPETEVIVANDWIEIPVPPQGYWIPKSSIKNGISKVTGHKYQYYTMIPYDPEQIPRDQEELYIKPRKRRTEH